LGQEPRPRAGPGLRKMKMERVVFIETVTERDLIVTERDLRGCNEQPRADRETKTEPDRSVRLMTNSNRSQSQK